MEFDENHKVKWQLIEKEEARAYIDFLLKEKERHHFEILLIRYHYIRQRAKVKYSKALNELWQSAIRRHEEDIKGIEMLIQSVRHWFEL